VARRDDILGHVEKLFSKCRSATRTRIHGDLHLGQVLVAGSDVVIIDFEGEPTKPLADRRAKLSPMRDVAGMIRSFDYAASITERERKLATGTPGDARATALLNDFRKLAETAFLEGYVAGRGSPLSAGEQLLIDAFAIEKAAYEISYEIANRPDWIGVPVRGLVSRLENIPAKSTEPAYG
jgi:maltose alpha-D-glucosyltransferase/alpha-amylase